ncbi:MAG: hypothetical protein KC505_03410 [Myxococcales bacterium]|nr:hypothetical protein [Myxococcales bacterium]USN50717.1 MAG: hypothetical protein H6731_10745 [Myxococcales bacterium]
MRKKISFILVFMLSQISYAQNVKYVCIRSGIVNGQEKIIFQVEKNGNARVLTSFTYKNSNGEWFAEKDSLTATDLGPNELGISYRLEGGLRDSLILKEENSTTVLYRQPDTQDRRRVLETIIFECRSLAW